VPKFVDIPQLPSAAYQVDVPWGYLRRHLECGVEINLTPDYQRGHIWSTKKRAAFVEYGLMGGEAARTIVTNCPGWMADFRGPYELVDGLQRVTSVLMFLDNKFKVFGHYFQDFEDSKLFRSRSRPFFSWQVLSLPTRKEVLNLYLLLNSGGVVHSPKEIARVKSLLADEK